MEYIPLSSDLWIVAFLVIIFASAIQGMTGFGAALVAGPILAIFLEPTLVVIINLLTGMGSLFGVVYNSRAHIYLSRSLPLILSAALGVPIGAYILSNVASSTISLAIAFISIIFSIILLMGYRKPIRKEVAASFGCGFTSGIMSAAVGMGGPPLILFMSNQNWPKEILRGTAAVHFILIGIVAVAFHAITGIATYPLIITSISLLPAAVIGFIIGNFMFKRISSTIFSKTSLSLILLAGITSLIINL